MDTTPVQDTTRAPFDCPHGWAEHREYRSYCAKCTPEKTPHERTVTPAPAAGLGLPYLRGNSDGQNARLPWRHYPDPLDLADYLRGYVDGTEARNACAMCSEAVAEAPSDLGMLCRACSESRYL